MTAREIIDTLLRRPTQPDVTEVSTLVTHEDPTAMLGARVVYWQSRLYEVKATGTIVGIREAHGVTWIRIYPDESRFVTKEHEVSAIISYLWE